MEKGGQPGNKNATKDRRMITSALNRAVTQNPDKLRRACDKVLDDAADGNLAAFTFIADRLEGKPQQTNVLQGDDDKPLVTQVIRTIVRPGA